MTSKDLLWAYGLARKYFYFPRERASAKATIYFFSKLNLNFAGSRARYIVCRCVCVLVILHALFTLTMGFRVLAAATLYWFARVLHWFEFLFFFLSKLSTVKSDILMSMRANYRAWCFFDIWLWIFWWLEVFLTNLECQSTL